MSYLSLLKTVSAGALLSLATSFPAHAVYFHLGNGSIDGSLCLGFDCVSAEAFGFDTLRLKENNLRIHFDDTSTAAAFPSNDWGIKINDSSNGGNAYYAIVDRTTNRDVFRVEAGARSNALYVEADGDIGIGTGSPATDIDIKTGNTPTVRLQQDGTSGFTPQTWDLAGNEAGFFIRDATNGSTLPFRIIPGASSNALVIDDDDDIGIGAGTNPTASLHVRRTGANAAAVLIEAASADASFVLEQNGTVPSEWEFRNQATSGRLNVGLVGGNTPLKIDNAAVNNLMKLGVAADPARVEIAGVLVTTGGGGACTVADPCDAVFDPDLYSVPSIEEHAALMWQNKHLPAVGPTGPDTPVNVTAKMLRMLNELEHAHIYIEQLNAQQKQQTAYFIAEIEELKAQLDTLAD